MVKEITLTSVKKTEIPVQCYGKVRFQSSTEGVLEANEYSFDALQYIIDEIDTARVKNYDRIVLLTGGERDGKSTLAAWMATKLGLSDPYKVAFSSTEYLRQLNKADDYDVTWMDEGARSLYSRDAMTRLNKSLTKSFTQIGIKKLVGIICLPHKSLLDIHIRERRIHYWGSVITRGYRRGLVKWRIAGKHKRAPGELRIPKHESEWNIESYWEPLFAMHFPQFNEHNGFKWSKYEEIKREKLSDFLAEVGVEGTPKHAIPYLARAIHSMKNDGITIEKISDKTGLSANSIYRYLKMNIPRSPPTN